MGGPATGAQRVLVVDDDDALRRVLRLMLEHAGYVVWSARDGRAALQCVGGVAPRAILLDAQMPRLDGFAFLKQYHALPGPHAPVALCTGSELARQQAAFEQVDAVLGKPVELDDLLKAIDALTTAGPAEGMRGHPPLRYGTRWVGAAPAGWRVWDGWEGVADPHGPYPVRSYARACAVALNQTQTVQDQSRWLDQVARPKGK